MLRAAAGLPSRTSGQLIPGTGRPDPDGRTGHVFMLPAADQSRSARPQGTPASAMTDSLAVISSASNIAPDSQPNPGRHQTCPGAVPFSWPSSGKTDGSPHNGHGDKSRPARLSSQKPQAKSPHKVCMAAAAASAAVSVRNTRGPSRKGSQPAAMAATSSWPLNPPSGPASSQAARGAG